MHRYILSYAEPAASALVPVLYAGLRAELMHSGLNNGTDGRLHVNGCYSPEYTVPCPNTSCVDCSYQLAILGGAALTAGALARTRYPADAEGLALFDDIVARIAPLPVDPKTGSWEIAVDLPFAVPHRKL